MKKIWNFLNKEIELQNTIKESWELDLNKLNKLISEPNEIGDTLVDIDQLKNLYSSVFLQKINKEEEEDKEFSSLCEKFFFDFKENNEFVDSSYDFSSFFIYKIKKEAKSLQKRIRKIEKVILYLEKLKLNNHTCDRRKELRRQIRNNVKRQDDTHDTVNNISTLGLSRFFCSEISIINEKTKFRCIN